jgi:hypothetical protein
MIAFCHLQPYNKDISYILREVFLMEWASIINIVLGVVTATIAGIGITLALRKRTKQGPQKSDELYNHLRQIGVDVYFPSEPTGQEKIGTGLFSSARSISLMGVKGKNTDRINLIGVSTQYGTNYFLDFQVESPNLGIRKPNKVFLKKKKLRNNKDADISWKGDESFSMSLGVDFNLEELIKKSEFKGILEIAPEPKHGCTRIRIPYVLPSPELFEAINLIAGHIKSEF